ncbi:hypothetical protein O3M35_012292 [Rhynocoris fuscipes]|uniref:ACB domain-containing protein n=1 Tax=Rhynocoris fuscipes TaxID=488301 RepID=A0AAW1CVT6_9HEMI
MALVERFNEAAASVKNLTKRPQDEELLELYGLFKQGNLGDNNTEKPGVLDVKGRHKWDAWDKLKGTSKEAAMEKYIEINFLKAVEDVKNLEKTPTDDELLEIYALYKQATVGDCNTSKPGMFDFKGKAKWEAWNGKKGLDQSKAKEEYINKVNGLIASYGLKK